MFDDKEKNKDENPFTDVAVVYSISDSCSEKQNIKESDNKEE